MPQQLQKPIAVLLMLLMGCLIFISFNRTVGGFNDFLLGVHMQFWTKQAGEPTHKDLVKMDTLYQSAIEHLTRDPGLLQVGGHLSEWHAYNASAGTEERKAHFAEALVRYRASIKERPTWPYTWFELSRAKVRASELDSEFQIALKNAIRFGPNERKLQIEVVKLGLLAWEWLDDSTQDAVWEVAEVIIKRDPKALYRAVDSYGRLDLLCSVETGDDWLDAECAKYLSAGSPT